MSKVKYQMSNVNKSSILLHDIIPSNVKKVKLLSERTAGVPPVIFKTIETVFQINQA